MVVAVVLMLVLTLVSVLVLVPVLVAVVVVVLALNEVDRNECLIEINENLNLKIIQSDLIEYVVEERSPMKDDGWTSLSDCLDRDLTKCCLEESL